MDANEPSPRRSQERAWFLAASIWSWQRKIAATWIFNAHKVCSGGWAAEDEDALQPVPEWESKENGGTPDEESSHKIRWLSFCLAPPYFSLFSKFFFFYFWFCSFQISGPVVRCVIRYLCSLIPSHSFVRAIYVVHLYLWLWGTATWWGHRYTHPAARTTRMRH